MRYTHTKTGNEIDFADPFKKCSECGGWITGVIELDNEPSLLVPCEHQAVYLDVCPSWSPPGSGPGPSGCRCPPGLHDMPQSERMIIDRARSGVGFVVYYGPAQGIEATCKTVAELQSLVASVLSSALRVGEGKVHESSTAAPSVSAPPKEKPPTCGTCSGKRVLFGGAAAGWIKCPTCGGTGAAQPEGGAK